MSISLQRRNLPIKSLPKYPTEQHWQAIRADNQISHTDFVSKWVVTHANIAEICGCSLGTVDRWFGSRDYYPKPLYQQRLAQVDAIWTEISSKAATRSYYERSASR